MGNAPNAVVPLADLADHYWAEVYTKEVPRQVTCHRCKNRLDVLWLQARSVRLVKRIGTQDVPVSDPVLQREAEKSVKQILNRPANMEHGMVVPEGFRCNQCIAAEKG